MLKGKLPEFSLGEILQSLAINHHTGTLAITAADGEEKSVYFVNGEITLFAHGKPGTPRIGETLVRRGTLTPEQLDQSLEQQERSGELLGKILLDNGLVEEDELKQVLGEKVREEIYELFLWEEGQFEFKMDTIPPELLDALRKSVTVTVNTNGVIMEGLRRLDEWNAIKSRIRTRDEIFIASGIAPEPGDDVQRELLSLVDGKASAEAVCLSFSGTRLECCGALFALLEQQVIRPLTIDELRAGIDSATQARHYPQAAKFLRYATQLCPDEPQFLRELGDCLSKFREQSQPRRAYLQALHLYCDQGNWESAGQVADLIHQPGDLGAKDLQILFQTFVELKAVKKATLTGTRLADVYESTGESLKAVEILDSIIRLNPKDYSFKIRAASVLQSNDQKGRAILYYEEAAEELESQRKLHDQIKVLRLIADLDPNRQDIKQKMAALEALQHRLRKRRKRRFTLVGVVVIILLCCSVGPVIYETKARELFGHAQRMEEIAMDTFDFRKARVSYEELVRKYRFSTKVDEARDALQRIDSVARSHLSVVQRREELRRQEEERKRQELTDTFTSLKKRALEAEEAGDYKEAHRLGVEILALGKQIPEANDTLLPLFVTSNPVGAKVEVNEKAVGKTPILLRYTSGSEWNLKLTLKGCETTEKKLVLADQYRLDVPLPRRTANQFFFASNFEQPVHVEKGLIIFTSRDGQLHAFNPVTNKHAWERRVGRFGDRVSDLHVRKGTIYVVQVMGDVLALDSQSGQPRWSQRIAGPVLAAPSTSEDSRFMAIASLSGDTFLLDTGTGAIVGKFSTENEISAKPLFVDDLLIVGSTDSYVYGYSIQKKSLQFIRELTGPVEVNPILHAGGVFLATADGRLHRVDPRTQQIVWSVKPSSERIISLDATSSALLVALSSGKILALDPKTADLEQEIVAGEGLPGGVVHLRDHVYVAFENGTIGAWNVKQRRLSWKWQAGAALLTRPLIVDPYLYLPCASGALQVLEMIE